MAHHPITREGVTVIDGPDCITVACEAPLAPYCKEPALRLRQPGNLGRATLPSEEPIIIRHPLGSEPYRVPTPAPVCEENVRVIRYVEEPLYEDCASCREAPIRAPEPFKQVVRYVEEPALCQEPQYLNYAVEPQYSEEPIYVVSGSTSAMYSPEHAFRDEPMRVRYIPEQPAYEPLAHPIQAPPVRYATQEPVFEESIQFTQLPVNYVAAPVNSGLAVSAQPAVSYNYVGQPLTTGPPLAQPAVSYVAAPVTTGQLTAQSAVSYVAAPITTGPLTAQPAVSYIAATTISESAPIISQEPAVSYNSPAVITVEPPTIVREPQTANSDWVVVEKAPRTVVRHKVIDIGPDGRYIIGEPNGVPDADIFVSEYAEGIIRLPDGRVKYADGTIQSPSVVKADRDFAEGIIQFPDGRVKYADGTTQAPPAVKTERLQGSIVALSDGSVLYPDGTIEFPDGTVRKPNTMTYSPGKHFDRWAGEEVNDEIARLREALQKEDDKMKELEIMIQRGGSPERTNLKRQLEELLVEKSKYERELAEIKQFGGGTIEGVMQKLRDDIYNSPHEVHLRETIIGKEDQIRNLNEQFLAEAKANAEARALLRAQEDERRREAETRKLLISEAVLRKESEMLQERERAVSQLCQQYNAEKQVAIDEERAHAERLAEAEIAAERDRLQGQLQGLQDLAEQERKRAEEEQLLAAVERERAMAAEEELNALRLAAAKKKKKPKKKARKGKGKAKAKPRPKGKPVGVMIGGPRKPLASKSPAKRVS